MEYQKHYDNMEQRDLISKDYAERSLRMIHDNFDPSWKRGDEPHGTLTFTDEPAPQPEILKPVRDLAAEIDEIKAEIEKLKVK